MPEMIGTAVVSSAKRPAPGAAKPQRWVVTIDHWHPTLLNVLLHSHHMKAHRLKMADQAVITAEMLRAGAGRAQGKRRVSLRIGLRKGQRAGDPDGYFKSLLDALKACRQIKDDNRQWCETDRPEFERSGKWWGSIVTLEDISA